MKAIILFAHGARDPEWARPFERLRLTLSALLPNVPVELAYLELMQPELRPAVADLIRRGATHINVIPMFMAQGGHLKRDLPERIAAARAAHPGVEIELQPAIGEAQPILDAMATYIASQI